MAEIDEQLITAANCDDEKFFRDAIRTKPMEYFRNRGIDGKNFLHIAMASNVSNSKLIEKALCQLPDIAVRSLMCEQDNESNNNPLHYFAKYGSDVKVIHYIHFRFRETTDIEKPWLARNSFGQTPLHVALLDNSCYKKMALSILDLDMEKFYQIRDNEGNTPLFLAMKRGFNTFALNILNSNCGISCECRDNSTCLFHVVANCSADVLELMLQKLPDHVEYHNGNQNSMLHEMGKVGNNEQLKAIKDNALLNRLSRSRNSSDGNTPLHLAIGFGHEEFALELVKRCTTENNTSLWWRRNYLYTTPFDMALSKGHERFLLHCIVKDPLGLYVTDNNQKSRVFIAVEKGLDKVVQMICRIIAQGNGLEHIPIKNQDDGRTVLHIMSKCTEEETGKMLVETFPELIKQPDRNEKYPIDMALEDGNTWGIDLLLSKDRNCIKVSPKAWVGACENGHLNALKALIKLISGWGHFNEICAAKKDSPLHHIRLHRIEDYETLLQTPPLWEMKNSINSDGKTPLHIALERKDIIFAEVLLGSGVESNIKDRKGKTAAKLLADLCSEHYEWHVMHQGVEKRREKNTNICYQRGGLHQDNAKPFLPKMCFCIALIITMLSAWMFSYKRWELRK